MKLIAVAPERRKLLDEFREVRAKSLQWRPNVNPHAARFAELQAEILGWIETEPADQVLVLQGATCNVPVSARRITHKIIDIPALFKRLGSKWIALNCRPTLEALKKSPLSPAIRDKFIVEEQNGVRTIGEPVSAEPSGKTKAAA